MKRCIGQVAANGRYRDFAFLRKYGQYINALTDPPCQRSIIATNCQTAVSVLLALRTTERVSNQIHFRSWMNVFRFFIASRRPSHEFKQQHHATTTSEAASGHCARPTPPPGGPGRPPRPTRASLLAATPSSTPPGSRGRLARTTRSGWSRSPESHHKRFH